MTFPHLPPWRILAALIGLTGALPGQNVEFHQTGEEFAGPFAGWKNVRTDYGAKGDGVADDTAAIQAAIDDLRDVSGNAWSTLYFPAGTYRLTKTLLNQRKAHHDYLGCQIIGEDPATVILRWDGEDGKWMWGLDMWYGKMSRFTFDGRGKAGTGLMRWNQFSTYCELSDLWFKDIKGSGICLGSGSNHHEGQAEHAILRCRFSRCATGILTSDWNTMDIYVWWCLFEDCHRGIYNNTGGYQAFANVFLRSTDCDLGSSNNHVFNLVNNVSVGSRRFLGEFAARLHVQGNRIYEPRDAVVMRAPDTFIDNVIRSRASQTGPCIGAPNSSHLFAGNTFTVADPIEAGRGRIRHLDQNIVSPDEVPIPTTLRLPAPPRRAPGKVFEVRAGTGDDAAELQMQIDAAAAQAPGSNPVVHLPKGKYALRRTVILPARVPLQIVGDSGSENGTVLRWEGPGSSPGLKLLGPSRVTMRDLSLAFSGSGADALLVENADQPGGRIFCDQVLAGGNDAGKRCAVAIEVDGLDHSDVTYLNGGWGEFTRAGVVVRGGPKRAAGGSAPGKVALVLGALGNNEYRLMDVQAGGEVAAYGFRDETPKPGALLDLGPDSAGRISVVGMSWAGTPSTTQPFINLEGFKGSLTYVGNAMGSGYQENDGSLFVRITGPCDGLRALFAASEFTSENSITLPKVWQDRSDPKARAILLHCVGSGVNKPKHNIPNMVSQSEGTEPDDAELRSMLEQIRTLRIEPPAIRADGVTDVRLHRVIIRASQERTGLIFRR
jgi:hypothetical protein